MLSIDYGKNVHETFGTEVYFNIKLRNRFNNVVVPVLATTYKAARLKLLRNLTGKLKLKYVPPTMEREYIQSVTVCIHSTNVLQAYCKANSRQNFRPETKRGTAAFAA